MRPSEDIENLVKKNRYKFNSETHEKVFNNVLQEIEKNKEQQAGVQTPALWRIIMKNPIAKIAIAAVIIIGFLILFKKLTVNQNSQDNGNTLIVKQENNNGNEQNEELVLAKNIFESKDIAGLSKLLHSDFEEVRMQAAKYLGLIGDETVLSELQILADKWNGLEQDNVYENAISAIEERFSEPEPEEQPQITKVDTEPNEPQKVPEEIQTRIEGIVIDKNNANAIQGVSVWIARGNIVLTDNDGTFSLTVPESLQELFTGAYAEIPLYVKASDYISQRINVRMEKDKTKEVTVELSPGSKVIGRVIDPNNQPVPDAEVQVFGDTTIFSPVLTDSEGKFEIDGIDPVYSVPQIMVYHSLYPPVTVSFQPAPAGQSVYKEIILKPGVTVFGQVTDSRDLPIKGVTVGNTQSRAMWNSIKSETDEEGIYLLDNVDVGELVLWAIHNNYALFVLKTNLDSDLSQKQIDIRLSDPFGLKGSVLDGMGNPSPQTYVMIYEYNGVSCFGTERYLCEPNGAFIIPNAPNEGELELEVFGQSISSLMYKVDFTLDEQLITINRSGRIYGQVIDDVTGKVISQFNVRMTASQTGDKAYGYSSTWSQEGHTFDSPDGYFDTGREDLPIGKHYRITVGAVGYEPVTNDLTIVQSVSENPNRTEFRLQPAKFYTGRIITSDGLPIKKASVVFFSNDNVMYERETWPRTVTDDAGIFSISGLGDAPQCVFISASGYTSRVYLMTNILEKPNQFADIVLDKAAVLYGYVYDENGKGISGASVGAFLDMSQVSDMLTRFPSLGPRVYTDKNGYYNLSDVPTGDVQLSVMSPENYNISRKKVELKPGGSLELNFGNEGGYSINGTIHTGMNFIEQAEINIHATQIESGERYFNHRVTDAKGQFKFIHVPSGTYMIYINWQQGKDANTANLPEETSTSVWGPLQIENDMMLDIDLSAGTVKNTKTGEILKVK